MPESMLNNRLLLNSILNRLSKEKKKDMTGTDSSIVGGVCVAKQLLHNQHMQLVLDSFHAVLLHMSQFSRISAVCTFSAFARSDRLQALLDVLIITTKHTDTTFLCYHCDTLGFSNKSKSILNR